MPLWNPLSMILGDATPNSESLSGTAGAAALASRWDHRHPRLTSATYGTLNASGEVTINFTRTFTAKPTVALEYEESTDAQPVILKVKSWITDGSGNYTGCVVKGYRLNTLPATITLLTALVSFSISTGSASGVVVSVIALQAST